MRRVISIRDVEEMLRRGERLDTIPQDAIITPSARDLIREILNGNGHNASSMSKSKAYDTHLGQSISKQPSFDNINSQSPPQLLEAYLQSEELSKYREQMLEIGRRMWQREFVDGNGGNMAIRIKPDIVLCTPTLVSKGFMKPEDLCLVDLNGNQLAGKKKRTSEIFLHLEIMKRQPNAVATVHCHPPYATAFAIVGIEPPTCLLPELEVFVGKVPIAPYETPGTPQMAEKVAQLVQEHNTILMGNHGAVSWSNVNLEDAYFKMEILEAYCRTVIIASQLGSGFQFIPATKIQDLLKIKEKLGIPDPRLNWSECKLCDNDAWVKANQTVVPAHQNISQSDIDPEAEKLVQVITDRILEILTSK